MIESRLKENGQRGLFATEHIYQGAVITDLPHNLYLFSPDRYSIQVLPGIHIDCSQHAIGSTNHSCKPNAMIRNYRLVAWSCIKQDEEITIDYRLTETNLAAPFNCNCGNCDGGRIE